MIPWHRIYRHVRNWWLFDKLKSLYVFAFYNNPKLITQAGIIVHESRIDMSNLAMKMTGAASNQPSSPAHIDYEPASDIFVSPPKNTKTVSSPNINFIKAYQSYSIKERAVVDKAAKHAISRLKDDSDEFMVAAAINQYVYSYFTKKNWAGGNSAYEALTSAQGNCGGMTLSLAEMLHSRGIASRLAYGIGGEPAHSMVEATFSNGKSGLFDPYNGTLYVEKGSLEPVSIFDIKKKMRAGQVDTYFSIRTKDDNGKAIPMAAFEDVYSLDDKEDPAKRGLYYAERILGYKTLGVQNSGALDVIDINLKPGELIGHKEFSATAAEPKPWLKLGTHEYKNEDGSIDHLSWAYMLGYTGTGYRIQHMCYLNELEAGKTYKLTLYVVNGYRSPWEHTIKGDPAVITLKQVMPCGDSVAFPIANRVVDYHHFTPQIISTTCKATSEQACILVHGSGNITLCGIELSKGDE